MITDEIHIDPYLFDCQLKAFRDFVGEKSNVPFVSFSSNPYTEKQEGYKYEIHRRAREALVFQAWNKSDIGSGNIIAVTIKSIEIPENNLVPWQARYGEKSRPHQPLYEAQENQEQRKKIENCLYRLYHDSRDAELFDELVSIFGKKYPIIAYLFFVKDRSKYLPIAPDYFDKAFELLGVNFKTSRRCSWENYLTYIKLINELKIMLMEALSAEVTLLDTHSFAWILSCQMQKEGKLANVEKYLNLSQVEREAIVKSRIGQGQFRERLTNYWRCCAVTGCSEHALLRASHIKPWSKSSIDEKLDLYNGILLSPTLDACFDSGYITFDNNGKIVISEKLSKHNLEALGIHEKLKLIKIEEKHKKYLEYHRENIFQK
jgi:predicted restriction endonuclease